MRQNRFLGGRAAVLARVDPAVLEPKPLQVSTAMQLRYRKLRCISGLSLQTRFGITKARTSILHSLFSFSNIERKAGDGILVLFPGGGKQPSQRSS